MRTIARGFTLIELMLVVAIIGLLAAIAIPKFASLAVKSKEAAMRGHTGALRSAISLYYANNEGRYPYMVGVADALTAGGFYLDKIPPAQIPTCPAHPPAPGNITGQNYGPDWPSSLGVYFPWKYDPTPTGNDRIVWIQCTHTDSRGTTWSLW